MVDYEAERIVFRWKPLGQGWGRDQPEGLQMKVHTLAFWCPGQLSMVFSSVGVIAARPPLLGTEVLAGKSSHTLQGMPETGCLLLDKVNSLFEPW